MADTCSPGTIVAGDPGDVITKYTFRWSWMNNESGISIPISFNINADIGTPSFRGKGPLTVEYDQTKGQPYGFMEFNGAIGGGDIYIAIKPANMIIRGRIEGGPRRGQEFVGSGTWLSA
ncbi:hypothetical protein BDV93DRAFT_524615 [Ceratobasidium sp. AG-I]|nr:hypothetical protein BDV93DRAFT_524615 [Ceratobasidium sp. AG-I]